MLSLVTIAAAVLGGSVLIYLIHLVGVFPVNAKDSRLKASREEMEDEFIGIGPAMIRL
ncbi:hypothetical protein ccbrp13_18500 [Ktedonobacteria bacterium brp13]|nr:hypothetical protein ccbrp13_18500 [Ktedonobacteria bacterium brp13]